MTSDDFQLRSATPTDRSALRRLALVTGMFAEDEMTGFDEQLADHLGEHDTDHRWVVATGGADVVGAAYYSPEPFGDRVWNLWFLAVDPASHRRGVGAALVRHVVGALRDSGASTARVLLVETSSTEAYAPARSFYRSLGFDEEARIREFYGPGDDKVVFWLHTAP